ncbi:MAG: hypothetical protein J7K15_00070 [Deltaproteobacteria bacterium]|nr:hypothetical protein [Deltaproteobacteria bacterium]
MKKHIFPIAILILVIFLSVIFFLVQRNIKKQLTANQSQFFELSKQLIEVNGQLTKLMNREEITLKKLKITNKYGDTIIELSENDHFSGSVSLYNKSKISTMHLNGGNKDENPGILLLKGQDEVSFALMVQNKQNLLNIYNINGLDTVSLGTDDQGNGGYSIKNAHERVMKTEGWGWRAYNY